MRLSASIIFLVFGFFCEGISGEENNVKEGKGLLNIEIQELLPKFYSYPHIWEFPFRYVLKSKWIQIHIWENYLK